MVAFPETEPMTIKRLEVALRNKDMYLLQEAANKLHEKYHTGFAFTMFSELSQIKTYIEQNDIPSAIKDVLCPTIESILSSAGKEVTEYHVDEEEEKQKEELKKNYDYNFGNPSSEAPKGEEVQSDTPQEEFHEEQNAQISEENFAPENNNSENNYEGGQQSFDFSSSNTSYEERHEEQQQEVYSENVNQEGYTDEYRQTADNEVQNDEEYYRETQTEQNFEQQEAKNESELDDVAIFYNVPSTKDETYSIKDYRQKLNFIKSNLYAKQPVNILSKISSIMDLVDVKDGICDFLLGISKTKCKKTFITTSINQNITNYLANNNVKFQIPMVQNTYSNDSLLNIIPMFGATNLFACSKCGAMFLNTGSYLKVLSLGCPECDDVAYPSIYDPNSVEGNSIFWHRAFSTMVDSKIWIIINPPKMDENEGVMDFLKVAFKSSNPKKIYIYSKDSTYENVINGYNKGAQILSSYDSLEALYNDLVNNKGIE